MRNLLLCVALLVAAGLNSSIAAGADRGTLDEAKAMAEKAADFVKSNGVSSAASVFMEKDGPFRQKDLYVVMYDRKGNFLAHGTSPALVGKNLIDLKDVEGKQMIRISVAFSEPQWIDYKWPNPVTKQVEQKSTYVIPVNDVLVSVGAYKGQ